MSNKMEIELLMKLKYNLQINIDDIDRRLKSLTSTQQVYECKTCNSYFPNVEEFDKHTTTNKHLIKSGEKPISSKLCNNKFYSQPNYDKHLTNGRCIKSRTCKTTGIVYDTFSKKSRAKNKRTTVVPVIVSKKRLIITPLTVYG